MTVKVSIIGASGYTGGELLRLLANHDKVELLYATSREYAGKPLTLVHPNLRGFFSGMKFSEVNIDKISSDSDLVFVNTPAAVSVNYVPKLLEVGLRVIDLSPDFRLKKTEDYELWYEMKHPKPELLKEAVFGLPELHRKEIASAKLVACPGCNSTAALLSLIPAVKARIIDLDHIAIDVKVGSSEAGRIPTAGTHHPERANVIRPYEASGHRHVAEVEQELSQIAGRELRIAFVPHAVGSVRGALATSHVWLVDSNMDEQDVWKVYAAEYGKEPFVRIVRGKPYQYPDPKHIIGSNFADVGFAVEKRVGRAALMAAIDNLVKGAAGQAIQCMNIMLGFDEKTGLNFPAIRPV